MNISIVTGFKWHAVEMGQALEELGHNVKYITTMNFASKKQRIPMKFLLSLGERVKILKIILNPLFSLCSLRKIKNSELVIVWSGYGFFLSPKFVEAPVVVVRGNHHIDTQFKLIGIKRGINYQVSKILEKRDYANAYKITVPTYEIANDKAWGEFSKKVIVAPYGFAKMGERSAREVCAPVKLIFAGALSHRKGFDRISDFFAEPIPDIEITLIGKREVPRGQIPKWWNYLGEVSHEDVIKQMDSSHILISLSREEGMARVGQEAMTLGLPVICTPESGLGKWIEQGAGVMTQSEPSLETILSAISTITENYTEYSIRSHSVASSWSWKNHIEKILREI